MGEQTERPSQACPHCRGTGACKRCIGTGYDPVFGYDKKCIQCGGSGTCPRCQGSGRIAAPGK